MPNDYLPSAHHLLRVDGEIKSFWILRGSWKKDKERSSITPHFAGSRGATQKIVGHKP